MASRLSVSASICLLLAIFLAFHHQTYDDILSKNSQILIHEIAALPEATIPQGKVQGRNMVTYRNRTIFGFTGIPYAKPPVGNLRFKAPVPANTWNGILDASSDSEPCPHFDKTGVIIGNEDCLYLNVYTPLLPKSGSSTLLPVVVYISGGSYKTGNNSPKRYGPDFLLDEDVVLVVPNVRVGALGYLSTGDEVAPGNYGLKDIVQSLKWIQDNIRNFSGDPNEVTLFGSSSGASSVHLLTLTDSTKGLFHRYITQGGSALTKILQQPKEVHAKRAVQFGEYFGCPTNTSKALVDCLKGLTASQLVDTRSLFYVWKTFPSLVWMPTSEPDVEGALLTDTPENLFAAGKIRDLPWISSVNRDDGLAHSLQFYEDPDLFDDFLDNIDLVLPIMLGYENSVRNVTAYTAALKSYYLNDLTADRSLLLTNLTHLTGDALTIYPSYYGFNQQLVLAKSPQYFSSFNYRGTLSHTYHFSGGSTKYTGVAHSDEIIYLFHNYEFRFGPPDYKYSEIDWKMVDTMVQLWTSFAINGTPAVADPNSNTTWEPYSSRKNYLQIGNGPEIALEIKYDLYKERMEFWDRLTAATSLK